MSRAIRRLLNPYWCDGNPLKCGWTDVQGPSGVLRDKTGEQQAFPNVGLFNLMWLALDNPDFTTCRTEPEKLILLHVIEEQQYLPVGKYKLADYAALHTLEQFYFGVCSMPLPENHRQRLIASCVSKLGIEHEPY